MFAILIQAWHSKKYEITLQNLWGFFDEISKTYVENASELCE
jgi:hypothetical protein